MNNIKLEQPSLYLTSNIALASFLALEFSILSLDRSEPTRTKFIFARSEEVEKAADSFWDGSARVNPNKYSLQMKLLKNMLFEK